MIRQRQIAVVVHQADGIRRPIVQGIGRFAALRPDWVVRWNLSPRDLIGSAASSHADGVICISDEPKIADDLVEKSNRLVIAGCQPARADRAAVFCDSSKVGALAAEHLRHLGHRHLACLCGDHTEAQRQRHGFVTMAREYDIEPETVCLPCPDQTSIGQRAAMISAWLLRLPRHTGIFVTCDRLAANICELARESRIAIPEDLAVIAAGNDVDVASICRPMLSTVEQPWEHVGHQSASLLDELISDKPARRIVISPHRVVRRASTETLAVEDDKVREAVDFIRQNANRQIGVRDVLKRVPCSRRALEQRFRRALQRTIMEEIRRTRLELAMQLLVDGDMSLTQIAQRCGLGTSTQLGQLTRRYTGLTPLELRQRAMPAVKSA